MICQRTLTYCLFTLLWITKYYESGRSEKNVRCLINSKFSVNDLRISISIPKESLNTKLFSPLDNLWVEILHEKPDVR